MKLRTIRRLRKLLIGLTLALSSTYALAAPGFFLFIATYWSAISMALTVVMSIYSSDQARRAMHKAQDDARNAYNASLTDRCVTALRSLPPWRVIYGRCITGGDIRACFTTDKVTDSLSTVTGGFSGWTGPKTITKKDGYKHIVISFADHQSQALNEVLVEGVPIGLATRNVDGWVTQEPWAVAVASGQGISLAIGESWTTSGSGPIVVIGTATYTYGDHGEPYAEGPGTYTISTDKRTITNTSATKLDVSLTVGSAPSHLRVSYHLGAPGQTVDPYLSALIPDKWDASHTLQGKAYVVITLDLEYQQFQNLVAFTFDVSGKLVYDPRNGMTAWSDNPALCTRDYLLGEYGFQCDTVDIDDTYTIPAANTCDDPITLAQSNPDGSVKIAYNQHRYTCNGAFTTDTEKGIVLRDLLGTMCGTANYGAQWMMQAGAWTAPVMDLGDDDLHGQIAMPQMDEGLDTLYNGVRGTYISQGNSSPVDFDAYSNPVFVAEDGEALWDDITLPWTDNKSRAKNICRIRTEQNRSGLTITYPAKLKAWPLRVGDRTRITSAEYGFSLKYFRVTDWQFDAAGAVQLTLRTDDPTIYDATDAASADPIPNSGLVDPWRVAMMTGLTSIDDDIMRPDGTILYRVKVGWAPVASSFMTNGKIKIQWAATNSPDVIQTVIVAGTDVFAYLNGAAPGSFLSIGVSAVNDLLAESPIAYITHIVSVPVSGVLPGPPGADGQTSYLHIKYSDDNGATFTSAAGETVGKYIGTYTDFVSTDSGSVGAYKWALIRGADGAPGPQGTQGTPGPAGANGATTYFHVAYANDASGGGFNQTGGPYIGTYVDTTAADSGNPALYRWVLIKGASGTNGTNGIAGTNGTNGQTSYLHIKYSNDGGATFTTSSGEDVGAWIGTYVDFTLADSGSVGAYTWARLQPPTYRQEGAPTGTIPEGSVWLVPSTGKQFVYTGGTWFPSVGTASVGTGEIIDHSASNAMSSVVTNKTSSASAGTGVVLTSLTVTPSGKQICLWAFATPSTIIGSTNDVSIILSVKQGTFGLTSTLQTCSIPKLSLANGIIVVAHTPAAALDVFGNPIPGADGDTTYTLTLLSSLGGSVVTLSKAGIMLLESKK